MRNDIRSVMVEIRDILQRAYEYGVQYVDNGVVANYIPNLQRKIKQRLALRLSIRTARYMRRALHDTSSAFKVLSKLLFTSVYLSTMILIIFKSLSA